KSLTLKQASESPCTAGSFSLGAEAPFCSGSKTAPQPAQRGQVIDIIEALKQSMATAGRHENIQPQPANRSHASEPAKPGSQTLTSRTRARLTSPPELF